MKTDVPQRRSAFALVACGLIVVASPTSAREALKGNALRDIAYLSGLGVVGRELAGEVMCEPNAAGIRGFGLSKAAGGPPVAQLEWRRESSCSVFLVRDGESRRLYRGWDFPEISYESTALVYYEQRGEFVRVLERTVPPGLWVRVSDVPEGRLRPWSEILVRPAGTYLGYDGQALRQEPSDESPVLTSLRERQVHASRVHQLTPTGASSGDWGEFEVAEFETDFEPSWQTPKAVATGKAWKGWLRVVTSSGVPAFWFYTRD